MSNDWIGPGGKVLREVDQQTGSLKTPPEGPSTSKKVTIASLISALGLGGIGVVVSEPIENILELFRISDPAMVDAIVQNCGPRRENLEDKVRQMELTLIQIQSAATNTREDINELKVWKDRTESRSGWFGRRNGNDNENNR